MKAAVQPGLSRRLGTKDAVVVGLGAMIGAGVFAAFGPAAAAAGTGLLIGLAIAAVVAYCNAAASAQLAAVYPTSGGTYVFGRERLGHWWGFAAGWSFLIGKTASCAAMALTFANYAVDGPLWLQRMIAAIVVVALGALNSFGVTKTAALTKILITVTLLVLVALVVGIAGSGRASLANLGGAEQWWHGGYHTLQAAGLLFFAFAGYARVATLGEEVRDPARTIPRAILIALAVTVAVYLLVAVAALTAAGPDRLAATPAPLTAAADAVGLAALSPVLRVGAAVASLGALLALMAGIGRTSLAMARNRDLPTWLAAVSERYRVPHRAEFALVVVVVAAVLATDLRGAIGFSSFGVLIYYAVANLAAFTQPAEHRRWPRALNLLGLIGCLVVAVTVPIGSALTGFGILAVGLIGRWIVLAVRGRKEGRSA